MSKKQNPKPDETSTCFACGQKDVGFGGPRRLEADHVAGEANNPNVLIWLCKPGCHGVATGLQYDFGVNLKDSESRSESDQHAALLQGSAMRMAIMSARQGKPTSAARFLALTASVGDVLFDRPDFDPESGVKSVGPNPLQNDIRHKRFAHEDSTVPPTDLADPLPPSESAILELMMGVDSELPGQQFFGDMFADSVVEALGVAEAHGLLDGLESVFAQVSEMMPSLFLRLSDSLRAESEEIDSDLVGAGRAVTGTINETIRLMQVLSASEGRVDDVKEAFEVFYRRCEEHLQSVA